MEIKTRTRFEPLKDGVCEVYETDEQGQTAPQPKLTARFDRRIMGSKRYFEARAAQTRIDLVIRVRLNRGITPEDHIKIKNDRYQIELIQELAKTLPPCMDLTLSLIGVKRNEY